MQTKFYGVAILTLMLSASAHGMQTESLAARDEKVKEMEQKEEKIQLTLGRFFGGVSVDQLAQVTTARMELMESSLLVALRKVVEISSLLESSQLYRSVSEELDQK